MQSEARAEVERLQASHEAETRALTGRFISAASSVVTCGQRRAVSLSDRALRDAVFRGWRSEALRTSLLTRRAELTDALQREEARSRDDLEQSRKLRQCMRSSGLRVMCAALMRARSRALVDAIERWKAVTDAAARRLKSRALATRCLHRTYTRIARSTLASAWARWRRACETAPQECSTSPFKAPWIKARAVL